uniref:Uncharacterized protein n=1 Tax=Arundo donax TaxID=35708 RepID=A0A0A9B2J3_ARUDO
MKTYMHSCTLYCFVHLHLSKCNLCLELFYRNIAMIVKL